MLPKRFHAISDLPRAFEKSIFELSSYFGSDFFSVLHSKEEGNSIEIIPQSSLLVSPHVIQPKNTSYFCHTCKLSFGSEISKFKEHCKTDFHVVNIKLKVLNTRPVSQQEFNLVKHEIDDLLDNPENEEDNHDAFDTMINELAEQKLLSFDTPRIEKKKERIPQQNPKVFFDFYDHEISLYKCIFSKACTNFKKELQYFQYNCQKWAFFFCSGGRFSCGIYHNMECVYHKSLHRYIVRKKQGKSQLTMDSQRGKSNKIKSAGSSLRRENAWHFIKEVQAVITKCHRECLLANVSKIFIYAPGYNKKIMFNLKKLSKKPHDKDHHDTCLFSKSQENIVKLPLPVKRPNFVEVRRIHDMLTFASFRKRSERTLVDVEGKQDEIFHENKHQDIKQGKIIPSLTESESLENRIIQERNVTTSIHKKESTMPTRIKNEDLEGKQDENFHESKHQDIKGGESIEFKKEETTESESLENRIIQEKNATTSIQKKESSMRTRIENEEKKRRKKLQRKKRAEKKRRGKRKENEKGDSNKEIKKVEELSELDLLVSSIETPTPVSKTVPQKAHLREKEKKKDDISSLPLSNQHIYVCQYCRLNFKGIPFYRLQYRYCSVKCVQAHKNDFSK